MVVVSHEMSFIREVADKVLVLADGVIIEEGSPQEVFTNPRARTLQKFSQQDPVRPAMSRDPHPAEAGGVPRPRRRARIAGPWYHSPKAALSGLPVLIAWGLLLPGATPWAAA